MAPNLKPVVVFARKPAGPVSGAGKNPLSCA